MNVNKPYRVLSLDGGGIRGLYTASVLQSLVKNFSKANTELNKDIGKGFDLIVGTSTGGILACGLIAGVNIRKIIDLYFQKGKHIFIKSFPPEKVIRQLSWVFKNRYTSANSNKIFIQELQNIFGEKTMGQVYEERRIGLCITAVNLMDHSPRIFRTAHNSSKVADKKRRLVDICMATSAAPVLFPVARIPNPEKHNVFEHFVDGGLWASSPVLVALMEAMNSSTDNQKVEIISIGTCPPPTGKMVLGSKAKGGLLKWRYGMDLMELTMDSQTQGEHLIADFLCSQLKRSGKDVTICRLLQTSPSLEQAKFLSLDQAGEKTCSLLIKLGEEDGRKICEAEDREGDNKIVRRIFSNLPDNFI